MPGRAAARSIASMASSTRLVLELDRAADPIAGRVVDERGASRSFVGWIGLASVLTELLGRLTRVPKEDTQ